MTVENKQSGLIQILDATGFGVAVSGTGRVNAGFGAATRVLQIEGTVTPTAGMTAGSYYQMARVPSNAVIKSVEALVTGLSTTTFTADVTIGISDSLVDGTQPALQVVPSGLTTTTNGYAANPALTTTGLTGTAALFSHSSAMGAFTAATWVDVTMLNAAVAGAFVPADLQLPLWQAAGYTQDPGGFFDIVLITTATQVSTIVVTLRVRYSVFAG